MLAWLRKLRAPAPRTLPHVRAEVKYPPGDPRQKCTVEIIAHGACTLRYRVRLEDGYIIQNSEQMRYLVEGDELHISGFNVEVSNE